MTKEKAIEHLKDMAIFSFQDGYTDEARKALDMAIEALQNSPTQMSGTSDLISIASETFGILAVCSIRYCQGRQSYMPSMVQDIVREHIRELDDRDLRVLIEDCNSMTDFDFGSEYIDKPGWLKFKAELEAEWERRGKHNG